jgi:hypothetical protein
VNEVQRINCSATAGNMLLTFRGETTDPIVFNATAALLKKRLEDLTT